MFTSALNTIAKVDLWIGPSFSYPAGGILVVGESWPGLVIPLASYIPQWLSGAGDTTYTQITNGFLVSRNAKKGSATAKALWDRLAFMNFVQGSVGPITSRPTARQYKLAAPVFQQVLAILQPRGCLIVGYGQSDYSRLPCETLRIPYIVVPHPRNGIAKEVYAYSWDCINRLKA